MTGRPVKDIAGMTFGLLTARHISGKNKGGAYRWYCDCACGVSKVINGSSLTSGVSKSCGCVRAHKARCHVNAMNRKNQPKTMIRFIDHEAVREFLTS